MNEPIKSEPIKGWFHLTTRDQLAALWSQSRALRGVAWTMVVLFLAVLAIEILWLVSDSEESMWDLLLLMAAGMAGWPLMVAFGVWRLSPQQRDVTYLIDGERIVLRDAGGNETSSPWHAVTALEERPSGFLLRLGAAGRWLSSRAFTPDALAAFKALARDRLGDRAKFR